MELAAEFMMLMRMSLRQLESVENALKYKFAINHEQYTGLHENNMYQSKITSTSL